MEPTARSAAGIRETKTIRAQHVVVAGDPLTDLVREHTIEVRGCDEGSFASLQLRGNEGGACRFTWVEEVEFFRLQGLATQFCPRGDRPYRSVNAPITGEEFAGLTCPRNTDTGGKELCLGAAEVLVVIQAVDSLD